MPYSKPLSNTLLKLLLPYILILLLVAVGVGAILIPYAYHITLERKKTALSELTSLAWHTLYHYNKLHENGTLTKAQAMRQATSFVRSLRYGKDDKQYFWIIDTNGVTIVHPYRPDLEGAPISATRDEEGRFFIREFIEVAHLKEFGFVKYKWQLNENPKIIKEKISCVRAFKPWGWIIGTGAYLDDVETTISDFSIISAIVIGVIILLVATLSYYLFRSIICSENERSVAYDKLTTQEAKIRMLVEAIPDMLLRISSDGTVLDYKEPLNFAPFIDPVDILDKTIEEAWPAPLAKKMRRAMEKAFNDGKPHVIRFDCDDFDSVSEMRIEASFVVSDEKEILATFRDITKRKKR